MGQQFNENLSAALASSDAAFRKSGENAEKAYQKARDAAGAARVEEAKLEDLRSKGTGSTAILAQSEKLEKARRAEVATTRATATAFRDLNDAQIVASTSAGRLHQELVQLATGALASNSFLRRQDITNTFDLLGGISTKAVAAASGVALVGTAAVIGVKQLYDLGAAWDDIGDTITGRTGIMGDQLNVITDSIKQVGSQSALSFGEIGNFAGGVAQSLHLSGDEATAMTQKLSDIQQVTQQAVDTRSLGKAFRLFDITDVNSEIQTLQQLTAASQATQIPINDLLTTLSNAGKAGKEAGLNLQQTLGVVLALEDAGVSFEKAGPALSIAMRNWSKEGRDANQALAETVTQIKTLIDAGNDPGAKALASQTFGKGYIDFFDAIKSGTLDVNNLTEGLKKLGDTTDLIGKQKNATEDWAEEFKKLGHTLQTDLAPVANTIFGAINKALEFSSRNLHDMDTTIKDIAAVPITPDSALGHMLTPAGGLDAPTPGATETFAPTNPLAPGYRTPLSPGQKWSPGPGQPELQWVAGRGWVPVPPAAGGPKLPGAPSLPYDTSIPSAFAGLPQTSEIVGAENSWMDARHTLAEKRARLAQLEGDSNAKADDITKAKNDIINAQQGQQQAELRLQDAQKSLYDKGIKQANSLTQGMDQIGVALDADLGISKGLPGLADNLVRFLASLGAAQWEGQQQAIINASPSKGGFGVLGQLGAQGAFGPQFTGLQQQGYGYSPSAPGPAGLQPGSGGGIPYGLPTGSNSGGYGGGGVQFPDWVYQLGDAFGVKPSTYPGHQETDRHEAGFAPNPDDLNRAIDWSGPVDNMERFSEYLSSIPGSLEQLIFQNPNTGQKFGIAGGQDVSGTGYYAGDYGGHQNHVHTRQSVSIPLPGGAGGGLTPEQWNNIAGSEASGNWGINSGNGFSGGLQFAPSTWNQYGGQQYAPQAWQASPQQQMAVGNQVLAGQGPGAWPATSAAHPAWFQPGLPNVPQGFGGQGYSGLGGPGPGLGGAAQSSVLPSYAPAAAPGGGGGGIGITPGGSVDTAMEVASSLFPGVGQAAQTGMKLANRAIQFGGQVAAIGVSGLMETFLPHGSPLADPSKSWFGKVVGGIGGARPALPNQAQQKAPPAGGQPGSPASGQGSGPPPGPPGVGVQINNPTFQGSDHSVANEINRHQGWWYGS